MAENETGSNGRFRKRNLPLPETSRNAGSKSRLDSIDQEAEESSDEEEDEELIQKMETAVKIARGLLIVFVFYAILGSIIYWQHEQDQNVNANPVPDNVNDNQGGSTGNPGESEQNGSSNTIPKSGSCSANSYLIGDRVCDDVTNNLRCLYDGGDCCLPETDTKLCQECICLLEVDDEELELDLIANDVLELTLQKKVEAFVQVVYKINNVGAWKVCARLCLDQLDKQEVNSWNYIHQGSVENVLGWNSSDPACWCTRLTFFCQSHYGSPSDSQDSPDTFHVVLTTVPRNPSICQPNILIGGSRSFFYSEQALSVNPGTKEVCQQKVEDNPPGLLLGNIMDATGGLLYGTTPVICGGYVTFSELHETDIIARNGKCFVVGEPEKYVEMLAPRNWAASLVIGEADEILWITGGDSVANINQHWTEPQLTTEYISLDELAMEGPFLPEPMKGHCLLRINSSLDYLIHGVAGKTWFHRNETFEVGQVLLERRVNTQCGLVVIPEDGRVIVVVTDHMYHTEIWDSVLNEWMVTPNLPQADLGSNIPMVTLSASTLMRFTGSGDLYGLECSIHFDETECQWQWQTSIPDVRKTYIEPVYDGRQSPNNPLLLGVPSGFQFC